MASLAFQQSFHTRYYFRLNSEIVGTDTEFDSALLFLALQAHADTAVLYRFDQDVSEFRAIAAHAEGPAAIRDAGVTLTSAASQWIFSLAQAEQGSTNKEDRFERFLERLQYGADRILVVPLRGKERLLGLLTLGRKSPDAFEPDIVEIARKSGRGFTASLERGAQKADRLPVPATAHELALRV